MEPSGHRPRATPTAAKVMLAILIPFIAAIMYIFYLVVMTGKA